MPILYSVVSRGTTVLARYASCAGNFAEVTEQVLAQIGPENAKMTYSHSTYLFHYVAEDRIVYLCITDNVRTPLAMGFSAFFFSLTIHRGTHGPIGRWLTGIRAFQSVPVPERRQEPVPDDLRRSHAHGAALRHEHRVLQSPRRSNGAPASVLLTTRSKTLPTNTRRNWN